MDREFDSIILGMLNNSSVDWYIDLKIPKEHLNYGAGDLNTPFKVHLHLMKPILSQFLDFKEKSRHDKGSLKSLLVNMKSIQRQKSSKLVKCNPNQTKPNLPASWTNPAFKLQSRIAFSLPATERLKITRNQIKKFEIIGQFDKRFIIVNCVGIDNEFVAILDQHASHERIRFEQFHQRYLNRKLEPPFDTITVVGLPTFEAETLARFAKDGLKLVQTHNATKITLTRDFIVVPDESQSQKLVLDLYQYYSSNSSTNTISKPILEYVKQRACKGAIKFGQELSLEQCRDIVDKLQECKDPFSCAHGRPSMVPLTF